MGAANYDPSIFHNPYTFNHKRKAKPLSFGGGIHYCLGAILAKMEVEIALETLFKVFPNIRFSDDEYEWKEVFTLRGLKHLKVLIN